MVARLSENQTWRFADTGAPRTEGQSSSLQPAESVGQRLLQRAADLDNVGISRTNITGISGTPLHLVDTSACTNEDCFITGSVFAIVNQDGSICLRLPQGVATDLIENGLCLRAGKNLLTWPPEGAHQLEVAWRILQHAYWNAAGIPPRHARRLWSEWVINH